MLVSRFPTWEKKFVQIGSQLLEYAQTDEETETESMRPSDNVVRVQLVFEMFETTSEELKR